MSWGKGKSKAGSGGKRGHSNMDHWLFNDEEKEIARRRLRLEEKREIRAGLAEAAPPKARPKVPPRGR